MRELEGRAAEAERLSSLLGFRDTHAEVPMLAARVIGGSPDAGSQIIFLSRGSRDGVRRDMGVITPEGVVGKVLAVYPDTSQVLLLSDKDSGVGALLADYAHARAGAGYGRSAAGHGIRQQRREGAGRRSRADLRAGPHLSQGFAGRHGGAGQARPHSRLSDDLVKPAAHLDQLEEVLVLLTRQEFAPRKGPMRPAVRRPQRSASNGAPPTAATAPVKPAATVATPPSAREAGGGNSRSDHQRPA